MNPLDTRPEWRAHAYLAQWVANLIIGATGIVLTALGLAPAWFVIVTSVASFLWTYLGLTAQGNVTPPEDGQ